MIKIFLLLQPLQNTVIMVSTLVFIGKNLHRKITAKTLAARAGIGVTGFRDAFQQQYGSNVFAFIHKQRMLLAHRLLIENYPPLKQIAAQCGFKHTSHFNRAIKKAFGFTSCTNKAKGCLTKRMVKWVTNVPVRNIILSHVCTG